MKAHLIVKLGAIGDVVMTLPAVKHFKEVAGGEIHWVCGREVSNLVKLFPFVDRVIEVDDRALFCASYPKRTIELIRVWRLLRGARYDLCAVLQYDWRYILLTLPISARRRIRLAGAHRLRQLIPGRYHGDEYARIMLGEEGPRPLRLPSLELPPGLPAVPLAHSGKIRIALIPGGAKNALHDDPQRRWPLSNYVELSRALVARGYEVLLIGGPSDLWASSAFSGASIIDCIGRFGLTQVLSLFESCDLVISHDTGPLHLAALSSAAVLALFGPVNPRERLPNRPNLRSLWGGESLACRPCYNGRGFAACPNNRCMKDISPAAVLNVAEEMLPRHADSDQKLQLTLV